MFLFTPRDLWYWSHSFFSALLLSIKVSTKEHIKEYLTKNLRAGVKRAIVFSSLRSEIAQSKDTSDELLVRLNSIMNLVYDKRSLLVPICLSGLIWDANLIRGSREIYLRETDSVPVSLVSTIVDAIPSWLVYDDRVRMKEELTMFLGHRELMSTF